MFEVESIPRGDPVESTEIHKQAVLRKNGLPIRLRVADPERDVYLYTIAVNANEDRPPGEYVLFVSGHAVRIEAYEQGFKAPGGERVLRLHLYSLKIPAALQERAAGIMELLKEAFEVRAINQVPNTARIEITVRRKIP